MTSLNANLSLHLCNSSYLYFSLQMTGNGSSFAFLIIPPSWQNLLHLPIFHGCSLCSLFSVPPFTASPRAIQFALSHSSNFCHTLKCCLGLKPHDVNYLLTFLPISPGNQIFFPLMHGRLLQIKEKRQTCIFLNGQKHD